MRFAVVVLAALLASPASHADPPGGAGAREALDHLDRGIAAYRLGDYEAAKKELLQARDLAPERANPYRWLALTEDKLGDCVHAVEHAEAFLSRAAATDARVPEIVALRENCVAQARTGSGSGAAAEVAAPLPPPPPPAETPITHRWWFWTAAGAIVVTGAGLTAYALTRSSPAATLPGVHCTPTGCAP